jgi:hypothetical protein
MRNSLRRWIQDRFGRPQKAARRQTARPLLELLEDRFAPAVFSVNTTQDLSLAPGVNSDGTIKGTSTITLRSAIQAANNTLGGNTINLTVAGNYKIALAPTVPNETDNQAGEFSILPEGNLTIRNTSGGAVTVRGGGQSRVFDINPADTNNSATHFLVTMSGFTITGGRAFDATGAAPDGPVSTGGGIRVQGNQSLTLTNMTLTGDTATADGGGVVMENTVNSNWTLTLNACTISYDHAGDAGGGIDTDGFGKVIINGGTITGNTDLNQGAGIYVDAIQVGTVFVGAPCVMTGTIVSNNSALNPGALGPPASGGSGGGISNAGNGAFTMTNCTVSNNFANGTGGGFSDENAQATLTVVNSVFSGNSASGDGGAIQEGGPRLTITHSSFDNNFSGGSGGAVFYNGTTLTIKGSTFDGNSVSGNGGAIEVETTGTGSHGSAIINSTITGNSALNNAVPTSGGGIDAANGFAGTLGLLNDTINANVADNGGGVFVAGAGGSVVSVQNTIIAQNTASATGPDVNGAFMDKGGNLIGTTSGSTGFTALSDLIGVDPMLGPLQYNLGPIIGAAGATEGLMTEALLAGSPAIDKGLPTDAPLTDERGFLRPDLGRGEHPDIGAFEVQDG